MDERRKWKNVHPKNVQEQVFEMKTTLHFIWAVKHRWIGHVACRITL